VPVFGLIDFAVGLLEIVSELAKILSFSFRLFGNIFAGSVLLFVMGSLVPVVVQSGFLMLEFFVGLIQAIVFGMLTMVFMAQATQSHHGDAEEHEEHA
jgi:F-type H+-transporting ATPase subunit a